ncbi:hypothetical protein ADL28_44665 [Streptomyces violaceusniger]|uniref:Serine hydrolase n=2 Tax=Streptomyces violaceusniger group TaxID=2839105 RepID=A0ABD5JPB3_9ACTN|nr:MULTISPECIES: serine hydrolase [Streptomyces]MEE4590116.1 serine hydrolase [Streptomyces sp. DSM 41602]WTB08274.1 serine hydrolase [Streptomyces antimycoticus]AJZ87250.1 serine hydrolase [Streptomyces sp. AgN23]KUL42724.1 hypothetical protein ADL28_44665 [Streptomyces violaceusniger]RSS41364.1 hypothetical protein EF902_22970 [Streptomyces sp. WAC05858]
MGRRRVSRCRCRIRCCWGPHAGSGAAVVPEERPQPAQRLVRRLPGKVNRFLAALVRGRLLRPAQLRQMMNTRPTGNPDGRAYGLGLESRPLPCGGPSWGHTGDALGYETMAGATVEGRQATAMVNLDPGGSDAQDDDMKVAVQTALCGSR